MPRLALLPIKCEESPWTGKTFARASLNRCQLGLCASCATRVGIIFLASLVSLEDDEQKNEATARSPSELTKERAMADFPIPGAPISQQMRSSTEVVVSSGAGDNKYEVISSSSSVRVFGAQGIALPRLAPRVTLSRCRRSDAGNVRLKAEERGMEGGVTNHRKRFPVRRLDEFPLMRLRLGTERTFTGPCRISDGGSCGTTSDFSGFLDGSTNRTAAFER